eukprot:TRINITY_DN11300_c0_g1_i3.p2 TRINITY_DN11300_c0_g1~~TRINITY_DN11300_c0_g1_i3.p2  ORF type:complete len:409 (+),score=65.58 TRINITY_DN11300_c0_g1_i3:138-1229(+)
MAAGALLMGLSHNIVALIVGRLITGIAGGLTTVLTPMYLASIAPEAYKGAVGTMTQLGVTSGLLLSQVLSLNTVLGTRKGWRYLLALPLAFAGVQTAALAFLPESPAWLVAQGKRDKARASLVQLRQSPELADAELRQLEEDGDKAPKSQSLRTLLAQANFRRAVLIGIGLQACQQLTGINAIFYFSTSIFQAANVKNEDLATLSVGGMATLVTLLSVSFMDRLNRKTLLVAGLTGMAAFFGFLTLARVLPDTPGSAGLAIFAVCGVVLSFASAPGNIPWMMIGEMFPPEMLAPATSLCVAVNWIFNFVVGISFQAMEGALSEYVFLVFVGVGVLGAVFVTKFVPETRGVPITATADKLGLRF